MPFPPCPECGDKLQGVYRNVRAYGICEEQIFPDGEQRIETDTLSFTNPKRIRCLSCFKIRKDLIGTVDGVELKK